MTHPREIRVLPDAPTLNRAAADEFIRCAREAIAARSRFAVALSGGSTPKAVYGLLASDQADPARRLDWEKIHIFFGDERHVPPTDAESNYRMASESLLSNIPIPQENVHRVMAELDANAAASRYEEELQDFFHPASDGWPRFDLIMLGMGPDGHTASLFPDSPALTENSRMVAANWVEKFNCYRITFTFPVLNAAALAMFLISGESKAEMLKDVLQSPDQSKYPCQRVQPVNGRLLWMVDQPAARLLSRE
ncbi:MAG: 6-phosphogluconolactonase [Acidobacteriia bacterium]|nr:6-phosphogluconolactonase [Terriglobia bacterium]